MSQCKINTFQSHATTPQKHSYSLPRVTPRPMHATWGPSELTTLIAMNKQCVTYLTSEVLLNQLCVAHRFSGDKVKTARTLGSAPWIPVWSLALVTTVSLGLWHPLSHMPS